MTKPQCTARCTARYYALWMSAGVVSLIAASSVLASIVLAQPGIPLVAVLVHGTEAGSRPRVEAFREGMRELGYRDGKNVRLELRYSGARAERLPELAREIVALKPDVAVASLVLAAQALHKETKSIPIVLASGAGADRVGLAASLARPGANVTGVTNQGDELTTKLFELLKEIAPSAKRVIALSSGLAAAEAEVRADARKAAQAYGMTLIEAFATSSAQLGALEQRCTRERCEALVVLLDPNLTTFRADVIALAARLKLPSAYAINEFAEDGGLFSYSSDQRQLARRAATYVDRILKGAKPGEMPIERPTRFEFIVNLKAARALGLNVPPSVLARADRVIQ
jgi:putative tryptophan/tyrosine transport system substrate-binding protein